jgi:dTDP-4-amino-4,6-dideoxygalactose transaminase
MMQGAIPIFVDVDPGSGNLNPARLAAAITDRTRGIVAVHLFGYPAEMNDVVALAKRHNLSVIEDCAQAHGALYQGRHVGSLGRVSAFSLNASKTLAGPEGGLLCTDDVEVFNRACRIRVFGCEWRNDEVRERDADCVGYNYRSNELCAAFSLARLLSFDLEAEWRSLNVDALLQGISDLTGLLLPPRPTGQTTHIYQMLRIGFDLESAEIQADPRGFRSALLAALRAEGCRWGAWEEQPIPAYTLFQTRNSLFGGFPWAQSPAHRDLIYSPEDYPESLNFSQTGVLTQAHYPPNPSSLMQDYAEAFRKVWAQRHVLAKLTPSELKIV